MRFTPTVITALLAGSALASGISARRDRDAAAGLEKRDCDCDCRANCADNCEAFNNGSGGGISTGLCVLTCADSCGCNVNKPCTSQDRVEDICERMKAIAEFGGPLETQVNLICFALGYEG